jgi:exoribonuclease-2
VTEFEGHIWLAQDNDEVNFICTTKRIKHKIQAVNDKGRELRLAEDKLLWQYPSQASDLKDWQTTFAQIQTTVTNLQRDIDIALLWESAGELQLTAIEELAELYFGQAVTIEHLTALWRTLAEDRLYFKRRGKDWEARSAEQITELTTQRNREYSRAQSQALAKEWLQTLARSPLPAFPHLSWSGDNDEEEVGSFQVITIQPELLPFVERLESWLRGDTDKDVEELVTTIAITAKLNSRELVFETLQKIGRLPIDADRDVIVAGLKPEFSAAVNEAAHQVLPWQPNTLSSITPLWFSIDDEETREVDDALAIEPEGTLWKLTIAIADPASVIHRGDTLDREAMRRGTTVYLPTQTVLMLPERISCDIASLTAEQIRSALVIRAWLNEQGEIVKSDINREGIKVLQRLHYSEADQLLNQGEDETAQQLRQLLTLAKQLQSQRLAQGALTLQRPEYKVTVIPDQIIVTMIAKDSPSRLLVAEMMILANHLAARYAQRHQIPVIYRCQDPPLEPVTEAMLADPLNFHKIRKLLGRSSLSLQPGAHTGLGLSLYTQLTSPLRRFADLVIQRQLMAHLIGDELPYDQEELFKVLETAERSAKEARLIEGEAKKRWLMQYLKQSWGKQAIEVLVISAVKNGYKVEMQPWAVEAFLSTNKSLEMGQTVMAVLEKIRVKAATARLKLIKSDE